MIYLFNRSLIVQLNDWSYEVCREFVWIRAYIDYEVKVH